MKKDTTKTQNKLNYLLDQFEETKQPEFAVEVMNLILAGKVSKPKANRYSDELIFSPQAKFRNRCDVCSKYYETGEPCFYGMGRKMHEACATTEEKENCPYWVGCQNKILEMEVN